DELADLKRARSCWLFERPRRRSRKLPRGKDTQPGGLEKWGEGLAEAEADGAGIRGLDRGDCRQGKLLRGPRARVEHRIVGRLDVKGGQWLAICEAHVIAQVEDVGHSIDFLPIDGQLGDAPRLLVRSRQPIEQ